MGESHVTDHLVAFVSGNLNDTLSESVRSHLEACSACRRELEHVRSLWDELGRIPDEQPPRSLERRFTETLRAYQQDLHPSGAAGTHRARVFLPQISHVPRPALQGIFGVILLILGFAGGYTVRTGNDEISSLRSEVRELSTLLTVSLLQQASASERLKGVGLSATMDGRDQSVTSTLVEVMNHDRNVNVRLAALDVLAQHLGTPEIRTEIIRTLPSQSSPLMQAAIVDVLVQMNDPSAKEALHRALQIQGLDPAVKARIDQGMRLIL